MIHFQGGKYDIMSPLIAVIIILSPPPNEWLPATMFTTMAIVSPAQLITSCHATPAVTEANYKYFCVCSDSPGWPAWAPGWLRLRSCGQGEHSQASLSQGEENRSNFDTKLMDIRTSSWSPAPTSTGSSSPAGSSSSPRRSSRPSPTRQV